MMMLTTTNDKDDHKDDGGHDDDGVYDDDCRHNDLPWQYRQHVKNAVYSPDADLEAGWPVVHTDIPRLRQGKLGAQVRKGNMGLYVHRNH